MNEEQIADIWNLFKEYIDKKTVNLAAEKFVDILADYGVNDETFHSLIGVDAALDDAINYYLDLDNDNEDYEE
jgi:hypothetical protein